MTGSLQIEFDAYQTTLADLRAAIERIAAFPDEAQVTFAPNPGGGTVLYVNAG